MIYFFSYYKDIQVAGGPYPRQIINADVAGALANNEFKNLWFTGTVLNPFRNDPTRNTAANSTYATYSYDRISIPFTGTASPMFNNFVNGGNTYDTTNFFYQNRANEKFKQRFVLKTDIVTTYANQWVKVTS